MSKELMIMMLKQGGTGSEILTILDSIINDADDTVSPEPTLDEIQFWCDSSLSVTRGT